MQNKSIFRVLAIACNSRGLGFAVMEGQKTLVKCGLKKTKKASNAESLLKLSELLRDYYPDVLVLENYSEKGSRRLARLRKLGRQIVLLAQTQKQKIALLSKADIKKFLDHPNATKHELAQMLGERFPEDLGSRVPPKRKAWNGEDSKTAFFDAAAVGLAFCVMSEHESVLEENSVRRG